MFLYNRVSKRELKQRLAEETFKRITISFYRYVIFENPKQTRDELFEESTLPEKALMPKCVFLRKIIKVF